MTAFGDCEDFIHRRHSSLKLKNIGIYTKAIKYSLPEEYEGIHVDSLRDSLRCKNST